MITSLTEDFNFNWHQLHPPVGGNWSTRRGFRCILSNSCLENLNISFDLPAPDLGDRWWTEASQDQRPSWDWFSIDLTLTKVYLWIQRKCYYCSGASTCPQAATNTQPHHQHTAAGPLINSSRLISYLITSDFSHVRVCFRWVIKCKVYMASCYLRGYIRRLGGVLGISCW